MKNRILFLSDFSEQNWSLETALREGTGSEVLWLTARKGNIEILPHKHVDFAVIDMNQFSLNLLLSIGFEIPVILLVESIDEIHNELFASPDTFILQRDCTVQELMKAVDQIKYPVRHRVKLAAATVLHKKSNQEIQERPAQ